MFTYLDGRKDMFKIMQEHCRNGHLVQCFENRTKWNRYCFLLETGKHNKELWCCCYERCPLISKEIDIDDS